MYVFVQREDILEYMGRVGISSDGDGGNLPCVELSCATCRTPVARDRDENQSGRLARVSVFERKFAIFATKAAPLGGRRFTHHLQYFFAVFLRRQHAGQSTVVFEICSECFHHLRYFYEGSTDQCTGVFEICRFSFHEEYRQHCIQTDSTIQIALSLECRAPPRSRDGRRRKNALALDVDSMNASILFVNFLT